jgi:drug/metabolite transporter (DMT)-like permease
MLVAMKHVGSHVLGIGLVLASTAFFGLAGVFTKAIASDPWTIAGWRGFVSSFLIAAYAVWRWRLEAGSISLRLGWRGWLLAFISAVASILFIASFKYTHVANVSAIYATAPFIAAAMEWLLLGERPRLETMIVAALSVVGVVIIVFGGLGLGNLFGDVLAILMTAACALYLVMIRAFQDTPAIWALAISAFLLFAASWFLVDPLAISARDTLLVTGFGVTFAGAAILLTEGARLLPAAEASLLGAAEIPFAVLFAWLLLAELPPVASIFGGSIVLAAVMLHAARDILASHGKASTEVVG